MNKKLSYANLELLLYNFMSGWEFGSEFDLEVKKILENNVEL